MRMVKGLRDMMGILCKTALYRPLAKAALRTDGFSARVSALQQVDFTYVLFKIIDKGVRQLTRCTSTPGFLENSSQLHTGRQWPSIWLKSLHSSKAPSYSQRLTFVQDIPSLNHSSIGFHLFHSYLLVSSLGCRLLLTLYSLLHHSSESGRDVLDRLNSIRDALLELVIDRVHTETSKGTVLFYVGDAHTNASQNMLTYQSRYILTLEASFIPRLGKFSQ